jgi:hypothetical protein
LYVGNTVDGKNLFFKFRAIIYHLGGHFHLIEA